MTNDMLTVLAAAAAAPGLRIPADVAAEHANAVQACIDAGWILPGLLMIQNAGIAKLDAARKAERAARGADQHNIAVGDIVRGRCVSMGRTYTGTVAEIITPTGQWGHVYRITETGQSYGDGRPIEPIIECAHTLTPVIIGVMVPGTDADPGTRSIGTGATLTVEGRTYPIPDSTPTADVFAPARIEAAIEAAGYRPAGGDYYLALGPDLTIRLHRVPGEAPQGEAIAPCPAPAPGGTAPSAQGEAPQGEAPQGEAPQGEAPQGEAIDLLAGYPGGPHTADDVLIISHGPVKPPYGSPARAAYDRQHTGGTPA